MSLLYCLTFTVSFYSSNNLSSKYFFLKAILSGSYEGLPIRGGHRLSAELGVWQTLQGVIPVSTPHLTWAGIPLLTEPCGFSLPQFPISASSMPYATFPVLWIVLVPETVSKGLGWVSWSWLKIWETRTTTSFHLACQLWAVAEAAMQKGILRPFLGSTGKSAVID